jgi:excinuclease UvrABC nuclease subunit
MWRSRSGTYTYWDREGRLIYSGSSERLRDRLTDTLFGRGELRQVPGKDKLPSKIAKFDVTYMSIE